MAREEPFFRKCCYCIPLKSCLQVWSCIKAVYSKVSPYFYFFVFYNKKHPLRSMTWTFLLIVSMHSIVVALDKIADISLTGFMILLVIILASYHDLDPGAGFTLAHTFIILIIVLLVDSGFMLVLTVGLCTNNLRTLRIFYYYSMYMAIVSGVTFLGFAIFGFVTVMQNDVLFAIITFALLINFGLDICIIFTLKSEMIKLRNKQQYEFVKMPSLATEGVETEDTEPFHSEDENVIV